MALSDRLKKNVDERSPSSYSRQMNGNLSSLSYHPEERFEGHNRPESTRRNSETTQHHFRSTVNQPARRSNEVMPETETNTNSPPKKKERRRAWFIWIVSIVQTCVFIGELIYNWILTGRPIETNLSNNPLFGPSPLVLINMGACFSPCMHSIDGITDNVTSTAFPCPSATTLTSAGCTLSALCGFNGVSDPPNQWYRFVFSIFFHVGIVHIVLNLLGQVFIGGKIERKIGALRTALIYFLSGIFGFIFGGNFGPNGLTRVGCSGSLFSIIALSLLDLFYHWKVIKHPKRRLIIYSVDIIINFVLGLLPGIDNFSHVGGFLMGLVSGLTILGSPVNLRRRDETRTFDNVDNAWNHFRCPEKFFHNRPKHWWTWWIVRFIAFAIAVTAFVLLLENFYSKRMKCTWCKYISCLPVNHWCDIGVLSGTNT